MNCMLNGESLTANALTRVTAIRNQETANPNIGRIIAAEIFYVAIIPISIIETAFYSTALLGAWVISPCMILFPAEGSSSRFAEIKELAVLSADLVTEQGLDLLWAVATAVMNLLPVKLLETRTQATQFFSCQENIRIVEGEQTRRLVTPSDNQSEGSTTGLVDEDSDLDTFSDEESECAPTPVLIEDQELDSDFDSIEYSAPIRTEAMSGYLAH